jgi:hypothetical protein
MRNNNVKSVPHYNEKATPASRVAFGSGFLFPPMTPKVMHAATPRTGIRSILMNAIIYPITMSHVNN